MDMIHPFFMPLIDFESQGKLKPIPAIPTREAPTFYPQKCRMNILTENRPNPMCTFLALSINYIYACNMIHFWILCCLSTSALFELLNLIGQLLHNSRSNK